MSSDKEVTKIFILNVYTTFDFMQYTLHIIQISQENEKQYPY